MKPEVTLLDQNQEKKETLAPLMLQRDQSKEYGITQLPMHTQEHMHTQVPMRIQVPMDIQVTSLTQWQEVDLCQEVCQWLLHQKKKKIEIENLFYIVKISY